MNMQRGFRDKLENYLNVNQNFEVQMSIDGKAVYDFSCFGVDSNEKLSDDRYMVFYNQTSSPRGEISYTSQHNQAKFNINLSCLPQTIKKLVFTASIDGAGTMGEISSHRLSVSQNGRTVLELILRGEDFQKETAITSVEIYHKGVWRLATVASGFNGGLGDLLRLYGGQEETNPAAIQQSTSVSQPQPNRTTPTTSPKSQTVFNTTPASPAHSTPIAPPASTSAPIHKVSLEKKLQNGAPKLISLAKPLHIELAKRNLLDCVAKVALVMDISGSMYERYRNGTVQDIINRVLPLAVQFDDDGELDCWYYGSKFQRRPSINMANYQSAVPTTWEKLMSDLGFLNNEIKVMNDVIECYRDSKLPAYVIFITDGGVGSGDAMKKLIRDSAYYPIFWQFVGIGQKSSKEKSFVNKILKSFGSTYGILEDLDNLEGRYVDNASFFAIDDFREVPSSELYSRLLNEFPKWLDEIKAKGMLS